MGCHSVWLQWCHSLALWVEVSVEAVVEAVLKQLS
uniref:Uncharacterized protein n=1 Tax=Amphimedon queenslandica TaxID=400682 RepID=A0A1X7UKJ0_AMPQE